jgi:hypothetical protein
MAFRNFQTSLHRLHQSRFLRRLEGTLWLHRAIRLHKTSIKQHQASWFFDCQESQNEFVWIIWHLETSLYLLHLSRFSRRPEGRLWVLGAFRLHKYSLKEFRPRYTFRCPGWRKWVRMLFPQHETSFHRFHESRLLRYLEGRLWFISPFAYLKLHFCKFGKSLFWMPRMWKMSSNGSSTTWNIASLKTKVVF